MNQGERVDDRYYEVVKPRSLTERLIVAARDAIYDDFLRLMAPRPDETILDVGASDVLNDSANVLERKDPHPQRITAVGLGEAPDFEAAFPGVAYRRIAAGEPLPFADRSFDVAMSNAVIEHVGGAEARARFVAELARVARRVFVSAPHRYFPIEHHTAIPLLHFWDPTFALGCRALGKAKWLDPANLVLIDRARLAAAAPAGRPYVIGYTGLRLGPFSSNLYLAISAGDHER